MEEKRRGEIGYGEWCIALFEMGICSCDGCGGHLVDGECISCGCGHGIQGPTHLDDRRYAKTTKTGDRCVPAQRIKAEELAEINRAYEARMRERYGPGWKEV